METYLIAARFLHLASAALVFGISFFPLYGGGVAQGLLAGRDRKWLLVGAAISLLSALFWWDAIAVTISRNWSSAGDPRTLAIVLSRTQFGHVWLWRLILATVLVVVLAFPRAALTRRWGTLSLAVGAGVLVASIGDTGHAVMVTSLAGALLISAQMLHILAAAAWLGGLVPLMLLLLDSRSTTAYARRDDLNEVLARFSTMGLTAVAIILATGVLSSVLILPNYRALTATLYGRVLLVKVAVFTLMTLLAADNRWRLSPRLASAPKDIVRRDSISNLTRNVAAESAFGLAVLGVVSLLGTLSPSSP